MKKTKRTEQDALGTYQLPVDAPWWIYTARVLHNFPQKWISSIPEDFLRNYVRVKMIYAHLNQDHKKISKKERNAIIAACKKLLFMSSAHFMAHFPVHQIQSGGGTSTNMNVNEVIANLATKELGGKFGEYLVNAHDHINASQSSNDTFPWVTRVTLLQLGDELHHQLKKTKEHLHTLGKKFKDIKKVWRTHLQDAVIIMLGDEFDAYARTIEKNIDNLNDAMKVLTEVNFGWTATGSKQNITKWMRKEATKLIAKEFKLPLKQPKSYFEENSSSGDFLRFSQTLTHIATDLIKIGNDLRMLASGPMAGFHEIELPHVQPGSSIMPGKLNPSIVEALTTLCAKIIGNGQTVQQLTQMAQLELQQFMPGIARALIESTQLLTDWLEMLNHHCLKWIKANKQHIARLLEHSFANATNYSEKYGYEKVAAAVKEAMKSWRTLEEILKSK